MMDTRPTLTNLRAALPGIAEPALVALSPMFSRHSLSRGAPLLQPGALWSGIPAAGRGVSMYTSNHNEYRMSTTMTVRLDDEVKDRLDRLATATHRSKSFLAAEAIRAFVENNEWQIAEIEAALAEADAGDFATDRDVEALASKWKVNAR